MKTKIFYYYDRHYGKPVITHCFVVMRTAHGEIRWSRGIAVCSNNDFPCKNAGRSIAFERARHAMFKEINVVSRKPEGKCSHSGVPMFFKAEFMPALNKIESKFIERFKDELVI